MLLSLLLYLLILVPARAAHPCPDNQPTCEVDTVKRLSGPAAGQQRPKTYSYVYTNHGTSTVLSYDGRITFTDDERDIKSISPGGYFRFSKTTFGNKREIYIQSSHDGTLTRRYYLGKTEEPYEPAGRQWLQEMLPEILATTSLGAEDRVRRIYAKSGVHGVLTEIQKLQSDHTQSLYFGHLLNQPNLKESDLRSLLAQVNKSIDSDHEKSKLLRQVAPHQLQNPKVTQEYVAAVTTMASDYEKARVLTYVLQTPNLKESTCELVLPAVARIASDYDQGRVLRAVLAQDNLSPKSRKAVLNLMRSMTSDYEKNRVLTTLMVNPGYVNENFAELLGAINTLDSDYEKSRALLTLAAKQKLTPQHYLQLLPVAASIQSNHDKSRTLQKLRTVMPADNAQVRSAYVKAAKTISSDHEYRRVMSGLEE